MHNNFKLIFIPIILTLFSIYYDYNLILLWLYSQICDFILKMWSGIATTLFSQCLTLISYCYDSHNWLYFKNLMIQSRNLLCCMHSLIFAYVGPLCTSLCSWPPLIISSCLMFQGHCAFPVIIISVPKRSESRHDVCRLLRKAWIRQGGDLPNSAVI